MIWQKKLWLIPLALGCLTLVSPGQNPSPSKPTGTIAVVDIVSLLDHLNEKTVLLNELDNLKKQLDSEYAKRQDEANSLQKELEKPTIFGPDTPEYKKEQDDLLMKSMELQAYPQYEGSKLSLEERLRMAALYKKVNTAVSAYAQANGIVLVFVADSVNLDAATSPDQLMQLIVTRKLLYYDKAYDITDAVQRKMNDDFALVQNKKSP